MTSLAKVACGLLGILSWLTADISVAQVDSTAKELLLKPFPAELLKSDFNSLGSCGLVAVKGDLSDPATSISGTNGFGLICWVKTKNTPKIWFARIAADGTYLKGHFLDQLVKRIEYAYQDGSILGLANTSIPAFIMFDPQGKIVWQYQIKTAENLAAEDIAITQVKDGYVITYYSHMGAQASSQGINYKLLKIGIEKIDRYGKIIWTNELKEPIQENAALFGENGEAVTIETLQDSKFAVSITTRFLDADNNPSAIHYEVHYYNMDGTWKYRRGFNVKDAAANADQAFSVDPNGNMIFIGYTGESQEDWQTLQQLQFIFFNSDGQIVWRQPIVPSIPPQTDTKVGAICMLWKALTDPQGDNVVICEQRYADVNGWVSDPSYNQLMAYRFNQEGKEISITPLLNGEEVGKNSYFESEGEVTPVGKNVAFSQGQLLIGLTKPMVELSKAELDQLMLPKNSLQIGEKLGIKIYQFSLPSK